MRRIIMLVLVAASLAHSASGQTLATKPTTIKVYTVTTVAGADTIFTDRKGCSASVLNDWAVIVAAENSKDHTANQYATVYFGGHEGKQAGEVEYDPKSKQYDLTREADLINTKCAPFLKAIPSEKVRKLTLRLLVE